MLWVLSAVARPRHTGPATNRAAVATEIAMPFEEAVPQTNSGSSLAPLPSAAADRSGTGPGPAPPSSPVGAGVADPSPASVPSWPRAEVPLSLAWLQPMGIVGLAAYNYVMRILTLGFYHFWGKTEVRQRIWTAIRLAGEPLAYHGTGRELLTGFLVVFALVLLPTALLSFAAVLAFGPGSRLLGLFQLVVYAAFFLLYGVATYRAQRYRLSRTSWRGIRGAVGGSAWRYALLHFWTGLAIPLTAGWIIPWRSTRLQGRLVGDMRFGDQPFRFTARARPLYLRFALYWAGSVAIVSIAASVMLGIVTADVTTPAPGTPRLGQLTPHAITLLFAVAALAYLVHAVVGAWYRASQLNHFAAHTHLGGLTFRAAYSAGGLIRLTVGNMLLVVLSLGLLSPLAQIRSARYFVGNLAIDGTIDPGGIHPADDPAITRGEGLAQAFDVDAF